jgi:hypothetical protein
VTQLQQLDGTRALWLAHTAATRAAAEEARALLAERHADDADPEPVVTAEEWLTAHEAAVDEDERHREITDDDLASDRDRAGRANAATRSDAEPVDIREIATAEPRQAGEDVVRVSSADEFADSCQRARRSLVEIAARAQTDEGVEENDRSAELARWYDEDQAVDQHAAVDDPVLESEPGYPAS